MSSEAPPRTAERLRQPAIWLARRRVPIGFVCGAVALWLARPSWTTWAIGCSVALVGEVLRIWAAGHLEKARDITASGPYRLTAHPLYVGSTLIGLGLAIAASSIVATVLIGLYLATTVMASVWREESFLRMTFGERYQAYRAGQSVGASETFSLDRARRNREYRAVAGLLAAAIVLALKAALRS